MTNPDRSLADQKAQLRKTLFARRKLAFDAGLPGSSALLSAVLAGHRAVPLAGYMPIRTEIDPRPAMEEAAAHGPVGVPVITAQAQPLSFALWSPDAEMVKGAFGAAVPANPHWMHPEILIVPLVGFSRSGERLGYGGGFYDRTLQQLRAKRPTLAIGFAFAAQQSSDLPQEPTDQPLDFIVTESEVIEPKGTALT